MALILPKLNMSAINVWIPGKQEDLNGRSIKGNTRGRSGVEVWWRLFIHHPDIYYRVLVVGLRQLLAHTDERR
jgi:hypothetical protein